MRLPPPTAWRSAPPRRCSTPPATKLARAVFAFAHGMALLELTRRLPADADPQAAWEEGIAAFQVRATARDSQPLTATQPH